jgi:hypothetical protein
MSVTWPTSLRYTCIVLYSRQELVSKPLLTTITRGVTCYDEIVLNFETEVNILQMSITDNVLLNTGETYTTDHIVIVRANLPQQAAGKRDYHEYFDTKLNCVASICKLTTQTERPPHVGKFSANFCRWNMSRGQRNESPRPLISIF